MKTNYFVTAQCEVLVEYAHAVMAKYERYLRAENALDCIKQMYKELCSYNDKIILCDSQSEVYSLLNNLKEYERIIENTPLDIPIGALV